MKHLLHYLLFLAPFFGQAQDTYFPPIAGNEWETVEPDSLGWCTDAIPALIELLETNNTKGFIVLKDGRIAIEAYFGTFTQDSLWYWASAGKSLTAFLVGMAQEDGLLDIDLPSGTYLGEGWTSCTPEQETAITVRDQLSMTSGLNDGGGNSDCTDPECLEYLADPGTRWAYHNAPYTQLDGVLEIATGQTLNSYLLNEVTSTTGISGLYVPLGFNNVMFSTARSMARFGLLAMNSGTWDDTVVLGDEEYFNSMVSPSQSINQGYGYLWWLNGQESYMLPGLQLDIPGPIMPNAPNDAYNAMGKNGQFINVVPSQGIVLVRMGNLPGLSVFVPNFFNDDIWERLNDVICAPTNVTSIEALEPLRAYPQPATYTLQIGTENLAELTVISIDGRTVTVPWSKNVLDVTSLPAGTYLYLSRTEQGTQHRGRFMIAR